MVPGGEDSLDDEAPHVTGAAARAVACPCRCRRRRCRAAAAAAAAYGCRRHGAAQHVARARLGRDARRAVEHAAAVGHAAWEKGEGGFSALFREYGILGLSPLLHTKLFSEN